jgi:transcriptional regulator with XRE-family HTH domain
MAELEDGRAFGALLRGARLAGGLTQEELAARSGMSVRAISDLERSHARRPYMRSVRLLVSALDISESMREDLLHVAQQAWKPANGDAQIMNGNDSDTTASQGSILGCQLPPMVPGFVGRTDEVERLTQELTAAQADPGVATVVISGAPGVGKTALALQVAHRIRPLFSDGQVYLDLAEMSNLSDDPGKIIAELLRTLGVPASETPETAAQRAAIYRSCLADRKVLVVADDAESFSQVQSIVPGTHTCAMILTSRNRLYGPAGALTVVLEPLCPSEAVEMLSQLIGPERVAADQHAAEQIVAFCDFLPLAVHIVGARLAAHPLWPIARLASVLADRCRRLDALSFGGRTMRTSFAKSYEPLDERLRCAFHRLALLGSSDATESAIGALLTDVNASELLNALEERSLLTSIGIDARGEQHYRIQRLLLEYASERLAAEPEASGPTGDGRATR